MSIRDALRSECNKMLKLRCAIWNGTYEAAFATYAAKVVHLDEQQIGHLILQPKRCMIW